MNIGVWFYVVAIERTGLQLLSVVSTT